MDKNGKKFQILATGDKTGNLILWRIFNNTFKILAEINNLSESNITNITWSPFGDFIYICNSNGSIYTIELSDSFKIEPSNFHMEISKHINPNNNHTINNYNIDIDNNNNNKSLISATSFNLKNDINNYNDNSKRKNIVPIKMNNIQNENIPIENNNTNEGHNYNYNHNNNNTHNHNNEACNLCKIMHFEDIQTKKVTIKLDLAFDLTASFIWENKVNSYFAYTKLIINNKILFYNHLEAKFIKDFVCNNFVYVYYDTNNLLHISSLLNTKVN